MKVLMIAIRSLLHFKWYTTINILGLALSLACVIVIFRYVYGELTVDRYIPDLDRVYVTICELESGNRKPWVYPVGNPNAELDFIDIRESPAIEVRTDFFMIRDEKITFEGKIFNVVQAVADSNYNKVFDLPVISGSLDLSEPKNAAISLGYSRKLFGDEDPLGKVIKLSSGYEVTIAAVIGELATAASFDFDLLVSQYITQNWSRIPLMAIKLYPNQDYKLVNEQYSQFSSLYFWDKSPVRFQLFPYKDIYLNSRHVEMYPFRNGNSTNIFMLLGAGVLILLIGIFNFANIYLAVSMRRGREWGMKKVFGARGPQIFTQMWVENTLLVAMSLLLALALTELTSPLVKNILGLQQIPFKSFDFSLVGIFFVTLPLLTTTIPFLKFTYSMPVTSLRSIGTTGGRGVTRKIFLTLQYAITIFMIVTAVFFNRQLYGMLNADPGFRTKDIIHVQPFLHRSSDHSVFSFYSDEDWEALDKRITTIGQEVSRRMDGSPLIEKWTFGDHPVGSLQTTKYSFEEGDFKDIGYIWVSPQWMDLFELESIGGRVFDDDIEGSGLSYDLIATETALKQYGIEDGVGAKLQPLNRLWYYSDEGEEMQTNPPYSIIGVVKGNFNGDHLGLNNAPVVFFYSKGSLYESIMASFRPEDKQKVVEFMRQLYDETAADGEFVYSFIEDDMKAMYDDDRKVATVFTIFTMIAILVSVMGLLSMSLFDIEQRFNEIAIRKVNGASTGQIITMLLRKYLILLGVAFLIAAPASWVALSRYLEDFAFKTPLSWWIFAAALLTTAAVSLLTLIIQTKKAAETNPASVIRNE